MFSVCILLYCILFYFNFLKMYLGEGMLFPKQQQRMSKTHLTKRVKVDEI